jgi:hypothetical protein
MAVETLKADLPFATTEGPVRLAPSFGIHM